MTAQHLPLEDTFGDVLRKALRGNRMSDADLARATGIERRAIAAWLKDDGAADDGQARAIARVLGLDPGKLADTAAGAWYPDDVHYAAVRHHPQDPHPSNGYVFFLDGGRRSALVDPAGIPQRLIKLLRDGDYHLQYVLITHKHADHCDATADVAAAFPRAQIVMHRLDAPAIGPLANKALLVRDGEELPFGEGVRIRMLHTPGHTDGSSSYLFVPDRQSPALFTGDTLFAGSVGGAYGEASTYEDILNSVRSKFFTLPDETAVMPGHGPPTTIGMEKAHNPFF